MEYSKKEIKDCLNRKNFQYVIEGLIDESIFDKAKKRSFNVQIFDARHLLKSSKVLFKIVDEKEILYATGAIGLDIIKVSCAKGNLHLLDLFEEVLDAK
ncbi:MAG: hypothetical protein COB02_06780 [Candidatus Cloacimonadota bacterium]|nr:MAG: hypothetical protein COB02_06780 [Candidatus Cloacimonadota bacterium]